MPAFPHAHDHDAALGLQHLLHDLGEAAVHPLAKRTQRGGFDVEGFPGQAQGLLGVKRALGAGGNMHAAILSARGDRTSDSIATCPLLP